MEYLRKIAEAYMAVASADIKREAKKFFKAMDNDGDHKVSLHEFLGFMWPERYRELRNPDLFKKLCSGDSENLDFMDVMTLYYIIRSGRPFCDACCTFIIDTYFCCTECFHSSNRNYCLCIDCYKTKKYTHHHRQFLDNFILLEAKRRERLKGAEVSDQSSISQSLGWTNDGETSLALVPRAETMRSKKGRKRDKIKAALEAFEKALTVGARSAAITMCAIQ